ncbi:MAG: S4 domain-containing protein [Thomasclavelia spiroformis]
MRLDKYLVNCYIGSRKEVREMIKQKELSLMER